MPNNEIPTWFKSRTYLHFDSPVGLKKACKLVESPDQVARHSFYPLISYTVQTAKIKKDKESGQITSKEKNRDISYAAHLDSHIYSYYAELLSQKYEARVLDYGISDAVLAFRSLGKSNIDFAAETFEIIKGYGNCTVVALDITKFFDTLDHQILKRMWASILDAEALPGDHFAVFKSLTKFSTVKRDKLFNQLGISVHNPKNGRYRACIPKDFRDSIRALGLITTNKDTKGIPQGTPISALLSNIYMLDFDRDVNNFISDIGGFYRRYCDDMLFVIPANHDHIIEQILHEISQLKIAINQDKTEIRRFHVNGVTQQSDKPLQYLGFTFDGERALIRSASLARYSERFKRAVRLAKSTRESHNERRKQRGLPPKPLYRKKLFSRYSHLGRRNFLRYGYRAAKKMDSPAIRRQLKPLWERLLAELELDEKFPTNLTPCDFDDTSAPAISKEDQ